MTTAFTPYSAAEITPEWLTGVLLSGGHLRSASVTNIERANVGDGVGFLGELTRLTLRYDTPEPGAPATLISKLPTAFAQARGLANMFRFYEREGRFYEQVAPQVDIRLPAVYGNVIDVPNDRYLLLLEDIPGAKPGDQLEGCQLAHAETVIRSIAGFHAHWWQNPQLEQFAEWMPTMSHPMYDYLQPLWQGSWQPFLDFQAEDYPRETMQKYADQAIALMADTRARLDAMPQSIAHTDFRLDNMFFGDPEGETPFALIDWQLTLRGPAMIDIGYFLSQSLDVELRRAHEERLVREYHRLLVDAGVKDYDVAQCWDDYRFAVAVMFVIPVTGAATLDSSNPRAVPLLRALAERGAAAIIDLDAGATLAP